MPNWITTKIEAPKHVIESMLNDEGKIDFNKMMPFQGSHDKFDGIMLCAEQAAEIVCRVPLDSHPLVASLQASNRASFDIKKLSEESFEQFVAFLRNYRECGYIHRMDFARKEWGTKWNACDQLVNIDEGKATFDTAWSCPTPVLETLSERFPDDEIRITYADEDIGSNCGKLTLKGGNAIYRDIAPSYQNQSAEEKKKWRDFAYEVKGRNPDEDEDFQSTELKRVEQ